LKKCGNNQGYAGNNFQKQGYAEEQLSSLDGNPQSMHHKVIIIDGQIVVTGSYNFSKNAKTRNDENTLILHSLEIADLYFDEFERVWEIAEK